MGVCPAGLDADRILEAEPLVRRHLGLRREDLSRGRDAQGAGPELEQRPQPAAGPLPATSLAGTQQHQPPLVIAPHADRVRGREVGDRPDAEPAPLGEHELAVDDDRGLPCIPPGSGAAYGGSHSPAPAAAGLRRPSRGMRLDCSHLGIQEARAAGVRVSQHDARPVEATKHPQQLPPPAAAVVQPGREPAGQCATRVWTLLLTASLAPGSPAAPVTSRR